ncbi:dihydrofolate reductase family protein [Corynebacterium lubricantis]|uniref:dihydrofolate reductase family protein n=1 Tax=Corynebacterium lubricantis TaxID=541095 RepID=UPI000360E2A3|nr:dihydrofolate reductase family protein [Corynebacterium lubricantis]
METRTYISPTELIGDSPDSEVRAVAIATLAGAISTDGTSQALGNQTDTDLLLGLRTWADCILVGANTVRAEGYGPSDTPFAIPSKSLGFDTNSPFFTEARHSPLILTPRASLDDEALAPRREALRKAGATLIDAGTGSAEEWMQIIRARGYGRITCEGGPGIFSMLFDADLIDVFHYTLEPLIHSDSASRLLAPRPNGNAYARRMRLEDARATDDSLLFLRYRRVR